MLVKTIYVLGPNNTAWSYGLRAVLDTGAGGNFVSVAVAARIYVEMHRLEADECTAFEAAGGCAVLPLGKAIMTWHAEGRVKHLSLMT